VRELEMAIRASYVSTIGKVFQLDEEIVRRITDAEAKKKSELEGKPAHDGPPARPLSKPAAPESVSVMHAQPAVIADWPRQTTEPSVPCRDLLLDPRATPAELLTVLENLQENEPRPTLPDLEMIFGIPATIELYRLLAARSGGKHLSERSAKHCFGSTDDTVKRWFNRAEERLSKLAIPRESVPMNQPPNSPAEDRQE
jgi:hypothetical protein